MSTYYYSPNSTPTYLIPKFLSYLNALSDNMGSEKRKEVFVGFTTVRLR